MAELTKQSEQAANEREVLQAEVGRRRELIEKLRKDLENLDQQCSLESSLRQELEQSISALEENAISLREQLKESAQRNSVMSDKLNELLPAKTQLHVSDSCTQI